MPSNDSRTSDPDCNCHRPGFGHVVNCLRVADARGTRRADHATWALLVRNSAVSGYRCDTDAGIDPLAGQRRRYPRGCTSLAGSRRSNRGNRGNRVRWPLPAPPGFPDHRAQRYPGNIHGCGAAGCNRNFVAGVLGWPVNVSRRISRRHAARGLRISSRTRGEHRTVQGTAAWPVLYLCRNVGRSRPHRQRARAHTSDRCGADADQGCGSVRGSTHCRPECSSCAQSCGNLVARWRVCICIVCYCSRRRHY